MPRTWIHRVIGIGRRAPAPERLRIPARADDELPVQPEPPWGAGWFDSSLDLRQGLAVVEHTGVPLELAVQLMVAPGSAPAAADAPT